MRNIVVRLAAVLACLPALSLALLGAQTTYDPLKFSTGDFRGCPPKGKGGLQLCRNCRVRYAPVGWQEQNRRERAGGGRGNQPSDDFICRVGADAAASDMADQNTQEAGAEQSQSAYERLAHVRSGASE